MKSKQIQLNSKVGLYMRLSRDDEKIGESQSIENQREILQRFIQSQGIHNVREYVDDGYSGTTFNRPEVQRLLEDAKHGKIDTIVVKDLIRFGRNYIEVGMYIDYVFPAHNIRFIALEDNVDSLDAESMGMGMMPIMNVFNEWHAANTSKKNKAVFEARAKAGHYMSWRAPYGYIAGTDEKRLPVIDEPAAKVVRKIFEMRVNGISPNQIAKALNAEGIPTPTDYRKEKYGVNFRKGVTHFWSPEPIREILKNPIYCGDLVQRKETTVSYKNKKRVNRPEKEWVVIKNTHEPIVSRELWNKVQAIMKSSSTGRITKQGVTLPLSGLLYCADCGSKMQFSRTRKSLKQTKDSYCVTERYVCGAYNRIGQGCCTSHNIPRKVIEEIVLSDIRAKAKLVLADEEKVRQEYLLIKDRKLHKSKQKQENLLKLDRKRLTELDKLLQAIYEDKVLGKVSEELCLNLMEKYQAEKTILQERIAKSEEENNKRIKDGADVDEFMKRIKKYMDIKRLTREICVELIECVTIDEYVKESERPRNIHIYYKLIDSGMTDKIKNEHKVVVP